MHGNCVDWDLMWLTMRIAQQHTTLVKMAYAAEYTERNIGLPLKVETTHLHCDYIEPVCLECLLAWMAHKALA